MKKAVLMAIVIILSFSAVGCTEPPSPPGSEIPMVVVDYVNSNNYEDVKENYSIIYVHGLDEVRYKKITINIENDTFPSKNHTYSSEITTNLTKFNLTIHVEQYEKHFTYNATFELSQKKNIMYQITYPNLETEEVKNEQLPFSEKLDQVEENKNA